MEEEDDFLVKSASRIGLTPVQTRISRSAFTQWTRPVARAGSMQRVQHACGIPLAAARALLPSSKVALPGVTDASVWSSTTCQGVGVLPSVPAIGTTAELQQTYPCAGGTCEQHWLLSIHMNQAIKLSDRHVPGSEYLQQLSSVLS